MVWFQIIFNSFFIFILLAGDQKIVATVSLQNEQAALTTRIDHFSVIRSDENPPQDESHWTGIKLPDQWSDHRELNKNNAWYQTIVSVADFKKSMAVLVPRFSMNIEVSVNGHPIGNGGSLIEPFTRNHGRPMIFYVPEILLAGKDQATLTIRVVDNSWALGYLGAVYVGDAATLTQQFLKSLFWQVHLPLALAFTMILFGFSSFFVARHNQKESYYLWFSLAMFLLSIDTFFIFLNFTDTDRKIFEIINQTNIYMFAICTIVFIHRFTRQGDTTVEPIFWLLLCLKTILLYAVKETYFFQIAIVFNLVPILYGTWLFIEVIRHYFKTKEVESGMVGIAGLILLGTSFHTWLIQSGYLYSEHQHLMHLGAPGFFMTIAVFLVRRFQFALDQYQDLAKTLESKVMQKENELRNAYSDLAETKKKQAVSQERTRIMREVHDGFGGQIVSAIALVETKDYLNADLENLLKSALLDLRVMIDSLDEDTCELAVALGNFRTRIASALRQRGISVEWDMRYLPLGIALPPQDVLNLMRVIQELFTNILKHSKADRIKLEGSTAKDANHLISLKFWENGTGFLPLAKRGRGLRNIHSRIQQLGGSINFFPEKNGFTIHITVPYDPAFFETGATRDCAMIA